MSSLLERLNAAHQARRAEWEARAKTDPGIDLKRIGGTTKVRIMPWASDEAVQEIEAHMEQQPIIVSEDTSEPEPEASAAPAPPPAVSIPSRSADIVRLVATEYGITRDEIRGTCRKARFVLPRQIAAFLLHDVLRVSYPFIGRALGGRDHSTALHAVRRIRARIAADAQFAAHIEQLKAKVAA